MTTQPAELDIVAIVPVRSGALPVGAAEVIAEAGGACWLIGSGCQEALDELVGHLSEVQLVEVHDMEPRRWSAALAPVLPTAHLVLPHSPDGRDLAPHLAADLGRTLLAGTTLIEPTRAVVARYGGLTMECMELERPVVATFQTGVRDVPAPQADRTVTVNNVVLAALTDAADSPTKLEHDRVELIEELDADPATMDLAEAPRIVAGGAGLGTSEHFDVLDNVSAQLGASTGATRVVTDWGWISADRQIGTTGVTVDPDLYLAVGISGAVQHTAGLGNPDHVVVINTDPSCPMMDLADLAIVCDGPAFVAALLEELKALSRTSSSPSAHPGPDLEA